MENKTGQVEYEFIYINSVGDRYEGIITLYFKQVNGKWVETEVSGKKAEVKSAKVEVSKIKGKVINGILNKPEVGVTVYGKRKKDKLVTKIVTTDSNGEFVISDVPCGVYELFALKDGMLSSSFTVDVEVNKETTVIIKLGPDSNTTPMFTSITGRVVDKNKKPLEDVVIEPVPQKELMHGAVTDSNGSFRIGMVPSGKYKLILRNSGKSLEVGVTVKDEDIFNKKIVDLGEIVFDSEANQNNNIFDDANDDSNITAESNSNDLNAFIRDIVFTSRRDGNNEIYGINADGTGLVRITNSPADECYPAPSPDGQKLAFLFNKRNYSGTYNNSKNESLIFIIDADGRNMEKIYDSGNGSDGQFSYLKFAPDGQNLIFSRSYDYGSSRKYCLSSVDLNTKSVVTIKSGSFNRASYSQDGESIVVSHWNGSKNGIYVLEKFNDNLKFVTEGRDPSFSPDGKQIVYSYNGKIYVIDRDGKNKKCLTPDETDCWWPSFSKNGEKIVFLKVHSGIFVMDKDGSNKMQIVYDSTAGNPEWWGDSGYSGEISYQPDDNSSNVSNSNIIDKIHIERKYFSVDNPSNTITIPSGMYQALRNAGNAIESKPYLVKYTIKNNSNQSVTLKVSTEIVDYTNVAVDTVVLNPGEEKVICQWPPLKFGILDSINVRKDASLKTKVELSDGITVLEDTQDVIMLAKDTFVHYGYWEDFNGGDPVPFSDLLAAWVTTKAPELDYYLAIAKDYLPDKSFDGYLGNNKQDVIQQVKAIFQMLKNDAKITYVSSTIAYPSKGDCAIQTVRLPEQSLSSGNANCIDGAVLYATFLEKIELHPYIVFVPGHAFLAYALTEDAGEYDISDIRNNEQLINSLAFLETTMTGGSATFEEATQYAKNEFMKALEETPDEVELISIQKAREFLDVTPMMKPKH